MFLFLETKDSSANTIVLNLRICLLTLLQHLTNGKVRKTVIGDMLSSIFWWLLPDKTFQCQSKFSSYFYFTIFTKFNLLFTFLGYILYIFFFFENDIFFLLLHKNIDTLQTFLKSRNQVQEGYKTQSLFQVSVCS